MKHTLISVLFVVLAAVAVSAQNAVVTPEELSVLEGQKWIGGLTYLDYSSNKKTTIKSNVTVTKNAGGANEWVFQYEYPEEPKANGSSTVALKDGGKSLNDQIVIEKIAGKNGGPMRLVTTKSGTDNDKPATFRYTYTISKNAFSIKKEVQASGSTEWFERNTYSWTR